MNPYAITHIHTYAHTHIYIYILYNIYIIYSKYNEDNDVFKSTQNEI